VRQLARRRGLNARGARPTARRSQVGRRLSAHRRGADRARCRQSPAYAHLVLLRSRYDVSIAVMRSARRTSSPAYGQTKTRHAGSRENVDHVGRPREDVADGSHFDSDRLRRREEEIVVGAYLDAAETRRRRRSPSPPLRSKQRSIPARHTTRFASHCVHVDV